MKCNSCQETISPKMRKAVENNICPFCGDKIVPDELRKSLTELDLILHFLLDKFKTETLSYLKDQYQIGERSAPKYEEHSSSDESDSVPAEAFDKLPLTEQLKNKVFRKKYMAAAQIKGTPKNEYMANIPDTYEENPVDDVDEYVNQGNEVDSKIERQLLAMSAKNGSNQRKSDQELLEAMVEKSKKPFSPPSF